MARHSRSNLPAGFTLIELMIVVACIGILASIAIPAFVGLKVRAARAEMLEQLEQLVQDARLYYRQHGSFPDSSSTAATCSYAGGPANWGMSTITEAFDPPSCPPFGHAAQMDWTVEPWKTLAQNVNAPIEFTRLRYYISSGFNYFDACALHDFDANGLTGQACTTLYVMPGDSEPTRWDTGWDDAN